MKRFYHFLLGIILSFMTVNVFSQTNDPPLIEEPSILRVGIVSFSAPFVMQASNNQFYGFDISTMNYICAYLKKTCQYILLPSRRDIFYAVANNQVDVGISQLVVRSFPVEVKNLVFSTPYLVSEGQFITLTSQAQRLFDSKMFKNKKIGVLRDSAYERQIDLMNLSAKIKTYETDMHIVSAIQSGELDYGFMNSYTALYWQHNSSETIRLIGEAIPTGFGLGILFNSNSVNLIQDINSALYHYQNSPYFTKNYNLYLQAF